MVHNFTYLVERRVVHESSGTGLGSTCHSTRLGWVNIFFTHCQAIVDRNRLSLFFGLAGRLCRVINLMEKHKREGNKTKKKLEMEKERNQT